MSNDSAGNPTSGSAWSTLKRRAKQYGVNTPTLTTMLKQQHGHCANESCYREASVIDHHHQTGEVRGLLCSQCNTALGLAQDHPEVLEGLATYLRRVGHYG